MRLAFRATSTWAVGEKMVFFSHEFRFRRRAIVVLRVSFGT